MFDLLLSSQGTGAIKLRLKSLILFLPAVLRYFGIDMPLVPDDVEKYLDAFVLLLGLALHGWGWIRAQIVARKQKPSN